MDRCYRLMSRIRPRLLLGLPLFVLCAPSLARQPTTLSYHSVQLELPGPPAQLLPCDLDGDGSGDLLVVVAYTTWDRVTFDRVEEAMMITDVVPALFDRREVRAFLTTPQGPFDLALEPLDVSGRLRALAPGPEGTGPLALTPEGVASFAVVRDESGTPRLVIRPLFDAPTALAAAEVFLPNLPLTADLDGDDHLDLLFPGAGGMEIYLSRDGSLETSPTSHLEVPADRVENAGVKLRRLPLPSVSDLDGDGTVDLLHPTPETVGGEMDEARELLVSRGLGGGRFAPPRRIDLGPVLPVSGKTEDGRTRVVSLLYLGDIDGQGAAEVATLTYHFDTTAGPLRSLRQAKQPRGRLALYHLSRDLVIDTTAYTSVEIEGHAFSSDLLDLEHGAFRDLDGDGRRDLVTVNLGFSLLQIVRIVAARSLNIGLDFNIYRQLPGGEFRKVGGLDLEERLKVSLRHLHLLGVAHFAGDFDGDGRRDFVHLGRGATLTVHRGQPECRYSRRPDLAIDLPRRIEAVEMVRVLDLDEDGRDDLAIMRPQPADEELKTPPVTLDLLLSGATR